jgi:adenylate cyclase
VADQLSQIEQAGRLKRFLAPQVAELVLNEGKEQLLDSHRRDITVVFGDLRGFTAFAETAEPEEVMSILREYHSNLGPLVHKYEGTIERFIGDGFLVWFNDPLPCPDPPVRAIRMAIEMRACMTQLAEGWRKHGHELGFAQILVDPKVHAAVEAEVDAEPAGELTLKGLSRAIKAFNIKTLSAA